MIGHTLCDSKISIDFSRFAVLTKGLSYFLYNFIQHNMAQQAKQAAQKLGGMFPQGAGKGIGGAIGAIAVLGGLGYGVNACLFNGKKFSEHVRGNDLTVHFFNSFS